PRGRAELTREMRPAASDAAAPALLGPERLSASMAERPLARRLAPVGPPPSTASPVTMADFMFALSGLTPVEEDPDIDDVQAFQLEGAQAALLVCRVKLRAGEHPEYSAEHVIDRMRMLWYQTSHPQWERYVQTVDLTRVSMLSRVILDSEDPIARAFETAAFAHFADDARLYTHTLEPIAWADAGHIEDFSW